MGSSTVAVVFATVGGLSDAGKFAAFHALKSPAVTARVVAMSSGAEAERRPAGGAGFHLDVAGPVRDVGAEALEALGSADVLELDVNAQDVAGSLGMVFDGADAVVACVGSREPLYPIWMAAGVQAVVDGVRRAGVKRLVVQSSIAHADDFLPVKFQLRDLKYVARAMWYERGKSIVSRDAIKEDFRRMEALVAATSADEIDYLLVRPVGLNPREAAGGRVAALQHNQQGKLKLSLSKPDAGAYLLEQALRPTLHRTIVSIGPPADGAMDSILPLAFESVRADN